jgi:L-amino acid N-acyltransferase YncA
MLTVDDIHDENNTRSARELEAVVKTSALGLLQAQTERPLYARAAKDNFGSVRVLEKCGFRVIGEETNMAAARGEPITEVIMELK